VLLCCGVNRLIGFLSSVARFIVIAMGKGCLWVLDLSGAGTFSLGIFLLFFGQKQVLLFFGHGWRRISHTGATVPTKSYHHSRPSPMRLNELWTRTCPDTEPPGQKPLIVNGVSCWVRSKRKRRGSVYPAT